MNYYSWSRRWYHSISFHFIVCLIQCTALHCSIDWWCEVQVQQIQHVIKYVSRTTRTGATESTASTVRSLILRTVRLYVLHRHSTTNSQWTPPPVPPFPLVPIPDPIPDPGPEFGIKPRSSIFSVMLLKCVRDAEASLASWVVSSRMIGGEEAWESRPVRAGNAISNTTWEKWEKKRKRKEKWEEKRLGIGYFNIA